MKNLREWYYPKTVEEAAGLLRLFGGRARIIAGGTTLVRSKDPSIHALVDITRLGLSFVTREEGSVSLGAATPAEQLRCSPLLAHPALMVLREAAFAVGPMALRNSVTIAGNTLQARPWSTMPLALLVLDAKVAFHGKEETRSVTAMYEQHPSKSISPEDLAVRIDLPLPRERCGSAFVQLAQTETDYSMASCGAMLLLDERGLISDARLSLGAIVATPRFIEGAGEKLIGRPATDETFGIAATELCADIKPRNDFRAGTKYRKKILPVLMKRALSQAADRAKNGGGAS